MTTPPPATILVLGATSAIAQATCRSLAHKDARFLLVGRDSERLKAIATDLEQRSLCQANILEMELTNVSKHSALLDKATSTLGTTIDLTFIAYGTLPDQMATQNEPEKVLASLHTNFNSAASLLTHLAMHYEKQQSGTIAVITSVAADRGRKTLYTYCAAKAGISAFTDGIRGRLFPHKVQVLNIKPGVVNTPMTAHLAKSGMAADPQDVAEDIKRAIEKKKDILYTPSKWWAILFIIRHIPERIFKRLTI